MALADSNDGCRRNDLRLTVCGPLPPPVHGQSMVMNRMISVLAPRFPAMRVANIGGRAPRAFIRPFAQTWRSARWWRSIQDADVVYIAVKAGQGMWLTTAMAGLARLGKARIFLHHHSYIYIRERKFRMSALTRVAGPHAFHIVLSHSMEHDLKRIMPEIQRTIIVGNAGLIDQSLVELPLKPESHELVLGHLSNLSKAKGIREVVDLAIALNLAGCRTRLLVGGPKDDDEAVQQISRAQNDLGELFEYLGQLRGDAKADFFRRITHFVFPSRNDALPLVLYEALAAGVVCVATRQGSIAEQLRNSPSILAETADSFVAETLPILAKTSVSNSISAECRRAYKDALAECEKQLQAMAEELERRTRG